MNYAEIRDESLKLINQYSIAGSRISESYNNQLDYLKRIPQLINDGQMLIATTAKPITGLRELKPCAGKPRGDYLLFSLPYDLFRLSGRGLAVFKGGEYTRSHDYRLFGEKSILIPKSLFGSVTLEYFRYPAEFDENPEEDAEADNSPDTHRILPYYIAAHLAMHDDTYVYSALLNEFEARLERLKRAPSAERFITEDAYGGMYYEA